MSLPRLRIAFALAATLGTTVPTVALAAPVDPDASRSEVSQSDVDAARKAVTEGEKKVAALQMKLDAARADVEDAHVVAEQASEKANAAREDLKQKTARAAAAREAAKRATEVANASQAAKEDMAAQLYMRGGALADLAWLFQAAQTGDLAREQEDIRAAQGYRQQHLEHSRRAQDDATAASEAATKAEAAQKKAASVAAQALAEAQKAADDAEKKATELAVQEKEVVAELAQLRRTSVEVEQRRQAQLEREKAQREAAAVRARLAAQADLRRRAAEAAAPSGGVADGTPPTSVRAQGDAAASIAFAQQQLGKPYLWGGNGPGSYDCSGLMVAAWRSAGRSLPRTAQWQFDATTKVAIAERQPGDLVFFGNSDDSIYHVGMYVGDGQMIEAPRTGLNIRYSSIYRSTLRPYGGRV